MKIYLKNYTYRTETTKHSSFGNRFDSIAKAKRKLTTKQSFVVRNMKKWKQFFNFHFFLNKRRDSNTKRSLNIVDLTNFLDEEIILTHPTMF